ncbi:M28 family peptidase [candidate division KSB1 bacterium]
MRSLAVILLITGLFAQGPANKIHAQTGAEKISEAKMRAHIAFLADDLLEGRGTGQRGMQLATRYMAAQFELNGIGPAGENGTYYQHVPIIRPFLSEESSFTIVFDNEAIPLEHGADVILRQWDFSENLFESDAVFVGYGISAPDSDWDDYGDFDIRGKVVIMCAGVPAESRFTRENSRLFSRDNYKYDAAREKGAAAALIIHDPERIRSSWRQLARAATSPRPVLALEEPEQSPLKAAGYITKETADRLFQKAGIDAEDLQKRAENPDFSPVPLRFNAEFHIKTDVEDLSDRNVLGIIRGTIEDEYVLVTSHLDALGIGPPLNGDNIYNGAVDNATGPAGLIEMGRIFAESAEKPHRSIVIIALAAEELGFYGARAYTANPIFPVEKILAVVNIDEVLNHGEMTEICVFGNDRSTLGPLCEEIARVNQLTVAPDDAGPRGAFFLSDQIAFAEAGIPSILLYTGNQHKGRPDGWSKMKLDEYYAEKIHRPTDEYSEDWDMAGILQITRFGYEAAYRISQLSEWPEWYDGQPYKQIREESLKIK